MNSRPYRRIASSLVRASLLCIGLIIASISPAASDQVATLTDAIARAYNPTQISAMIAAAAGRGGADLHSQSFEPLRHALEVNNEVAVALLRIHDGIGVTPDRLANDLAESATRYHAVVDGLAAINVGNPIESQMVKQAQAAMSAGRFSEAEAELRQIADREAAASGRSTGAGPALEAYTNEHRHVAARARTLLGTIALMKLEYREAADHFLVARQLLLTPPEEPGVIQPRPVTATGDARAAEPPHEQVAVTGAAAPIDVHEATETMAPIAAPPAIAHDEAAEAPERVIVALVQPTAMKPAATPNRPETAPAPFAEAVAKLPPAVASLSTDKLQLLLSRGDAMLALGNIISARLLYARAASAGDSRGAIGVAKTYDPSVLSQIGARGIQADPATAAIWYRKAVDLGDGSAAVHLRLLGQASSQ